jgi:hypothetical protein
MQDDVKVRSGRQLGSMNAADRERRVAELAEKLFVVAYARQPMSVLPVLHSQIQQAFEAAEFYVEQLERRMGLLE